MPAHPLVRLHHLSRQLLHVVRLGRRRTGRRRGHSLASDADGRRRDDYPAGVIVEHGGHERQLAASRRCVSAHAARQRAPATAHLLLQLRHDVRLLLWRRRRHGAATAVSALPSAAHPPFARRARSRLGVQPHGKMRSLLEAGDHEAVLDAKAHAPAVLDSFFKTTPAL